MILHRIKFILILAGLLVARLSISQISIKEYEQLEQEYKSENIVQLIDKTEYIVDIVKGELVIYEHKYAKYLFLKNRMGNPFKQYVYTSEFHDLEEFEANAYVLEGKKYKKIPVKTYTEKSNSGSRSFYDDVNELSFTFPGVTTGSVVEFTTKIKVNEPRLLSSSFLYSYYPVKEFEVIYNSTVDVNLDIIEFNANSDELKVIAKVEKDRKLSSVKLSNMPATVMENNTPNIRYFIPHLIPIIRSYTYKGHKIEILADNASLYKWYYSFIAESKKEVDYTELKQLADSLTRECNTEFEKVEALYYWVQRNIKYIAFEYGTGGFIPRKPDDILKNKYGDCKDKSSLLHELTNQAGITTYFTWIGTRDLPYSYTDVSSPISDNHMILTYIDSDSNYHFLDGTAKYNHISYPTSFIQGKEAMIGINDSVFHIQEVPTARYNQSQWHDSVNITLDGNKLKGMGSLTLSGYQYIEGRYRMNSSDEEHLDKYFEELLQKGNNKFLLEDYKLSELSDFDSNLTVNYQYELSNYARNVGTELYINLNLNKDLLELKVKPDRKYPVSFDYLTQLNNIFILDIPNGYQVSSVPTKSSFSNENFGFSIQYEQQESKVFYRHTFYVNTNVVNMDTMKSWKELISELEKAYKQSVLLTSQP